MKNLMGALVALFLFVHPAQARDPAPLNRVLKITISVTSLTHPKEYEAIRVWLPFESRHACQGAQERIEGPAIKKFAELKLKAELRHITVRHVYTECVPAASDI